VPNALESGKGICDDDGREERPMSKQNGGAKRLKPGQLRQQRMLREQEKITDAELQAIRERCAAATPGKWISCPIRVELGQGTVQGSGVYCPKPLVSVCVVPGHTCYPEGNTPEQIAADSAFIAHARADIPALLAEVDRLKALLADVGYQSLAAEMTNALYGIR
jgi:hypothetical protein